MPYAANLEKLALINAAGVVRRQRRSAIAEPGLGPDRALMLLHFPSRVRPAIAALWAIDEAMGDTVMHATQPALAAIKLAWWREALIRLDSDPAPPEPRLRAAAQAILPLGISGSAVARLEEGWSALIEEQPDAGRVGQRGKVLFALEAAILGSRIRSSIRQVIFSRSRMRGVAGWQISTSSVAKLSTNFGASGYPARLARSPLPPVLQAVR